MIFILLTVYGLSFHGNCTPIGPNSVLALTARIFYHYRCVLWAHVRCGEGICFHSQPCLVEFCFSSCFFFFFLFSTGSIALMLKNLFWFLIKTWYAGHDMCLRFCPWLYVLYGMQHTVPLFASMCAHALAYPRV